MKAVRTDGTRVLLKFKPRWESCLRRVFTKEKCHFQHVKRSSDQIRTFEFRLFCWGNLQLETFVKCWAVGVGHKTSTVTFVRLWIVSSRSGLDTAAVAQNGAEIRAHWKRLSGSTEVECVLNVKGETTSAKKHAQKHNSTNVLVFCVSVVESEGFWTDDFVHFGWFFNRGITRTLVLIVLHGPWIRRVNSFRHLKHFHLKVSICF